jgi:hypothetical protein
MNTRRTGAPPATTQHGTSLTRPPRPSRLGRVAWVVILVADAGIVLYGVLAVATPSLLTAGYESYSGTSWASLVARAPDTAAYLLLVYRMVGGLNVALGITLLAIIVGPFRRGERWAWFTVLGGNVLGFGVPMTYDQITGAIGFFEVLEFVAIAAVLVALALSARGKAGVR